MSESAATPAQSGSAASGRDIDTDGRIVEAALSLAAEEGWRDLPLKRIAKAAGLPLSALYRRMGSKTGILRVYGRQLDQEVLDEPVEDEDRPRDRLFDIAMARFEAMEPQKEALWVIWHDIRRDPLTLASLAPDARRSATWLLEAAGIGTDGWRGAVRVRLVMVALGQTFRVWLDEESADLSKTMAELDKRLRGIENWLDPRAARQDRRGAGSADDTAADDPPADLPGDLPAADGSPAAKSNGQV